MKPPKGSTRMKAVELRFIADAAKPIRVRNLPATAFIATGQRPALMSAITQAERVAAISRHLVYKGIDGLVAFGKEAWKPGLG